MKWLLAAALLGGSNGAARGPSHSACTVYSTVAASDAWLAKVSQLPLRQQVAALRRRIGCDVGVHGQVFEAGVCVSCLSTEGKQAYQAAQEKRRLAAAADARPRGITLAYIVDGQWLTTEGIAAIQQAITNKNIKQLSFIESGAAVAIGGTRAQNGLVVLTTSHYPPTAAK